MSADERSAADAVYVLSAIARLLRASPYRGQVPVDWVEMHAGYLEDIAGAVARDANLEPKQLADGAGYVGTEWESALIPIIFPEDSTEAVFLRARESGPRP